MALRPGRLAEDFIAAQLTDSSRQELVTDLLADADPGSDRAAIRRCLDTLAAASRYPQVRCVLLGILRARSELARFAPPPALYAVLEHGDRPLIETVHTALPWQGTELLRPARDFARQLLDTLPADAPDWQRARLLMSLGRRLARAGDKQAALATDREAVAACRQLVSADPRHLPLLAIALNDLGQSLASTGDHPAALAAAGEAGDLIQQVARTEPAAAGPLVTAAFQSNLGDILADVGDKPAALAATTRLAETILQTAEAESIPPDLLAHSLRNIALRLVDLGEKRSAPKAAKEAARIYRQLAEPNPTSSCRTSPALCGQWPGSRRSAST